MTKPMAMRACLVFFLLAALGFGGNDPKALDDHAIVEQIRNHTQTMKRITKERFKMDSIVVQYCRPVGPVPHSPHEDRYCHVFVSKNARKAMNSGKEKYPIGAMIVKAKYMDQKSSDIELFTAMIKRELGYDPKHSDWEYLLIDGKCKTVYARGRLESCIQCHEDYAATDYVTRLYMPSKPAKN